MVEKESPEKRSVASPKINAIPCYILAIGMAKALHLEQGLSFG